MLRFRSLASGSSGNATLIEAGSGIHRTRLLVDCGLGLRQLTDRLDAAGLCVHELDAIFITHEHGDHVGCAVAISQRFGVPLLMSHGTAAAIGVADDHPRLQLARDGESIALGELLMEPFTVPHDAREPLQLVCGDGARRLGFATDLGHVTPYVLARLQGCHALLMEANHDPDLLAASHYPPFLKRRVGGQHGHLSNAQASAALATLRHEHLNVVMAAHLSEHNNRPHLALAAFADALGCGPQDVLLTSRAGVSWITA